MESKAVGCRGSTRRTCLSLCLHKSWWLNFWIGRAVRPMFRRKNCFWCTSCPITTFCPHRSRPDKACDIGRPRSIILTTCHFGAPQGSSVLLLSRHWTLPKAVGDRQTINKSLCEVVLKILLSDEASVEYKIKCVVRLRCQGFTNHRDSLSRYPRNIPTIVASTRVYINSCSPILGRSWDSPDIGDPDIRENACCCNEQDIRSPKWMTC